MKWAMACMQGWRIDMEDDHIILPNFTDNLALFAVFDGHGGPEVAHVAAKLYPNFLKSNEYFKKKDYARALISSFEKFDLFMMSEEGKKVFKANSIMKTEMELCAGSTAIVALVEKDYVKEEGDQREVGVRVYKDMDIRKGKWEEYKKKKEEMVWDEKRESTHGGKKWRIWVANAGDCRSLLVQSPERVFALNEEHKPMDAREKQRIQKAGGLILKMRIDENLNLSRALGDFHYKSNFNLPFDEQLIISKPDIYEVVVDTKEPCYLFLGCDGVFEVLADRQIGQQVMEGMKKQEEGPSLVDEIKKVIEDEEEEEEENGNQQEGESNSGESLKSSVETEKKDQNEDVDKDKEEGDQIENKQESKDEEDHELKVMVENLKKVLMRTLAKPGQITMGMGYDNMSALCVKLGV
jgi:serine/threonine protein phosphatase PrpC